MSRRTDLAGRTCLVTGAASGIGRATALALVDKRAPLVLTDVAAAGLQETAEAVRAAGGTVLHAAPADLRDHDAVTALAADVHGAHGAVGAVMNIAGVSTWGSVQRLRHSDWQRMVDVNLMGPINVIEAFVPPMIDAGKGGHVVNVSSAAGLIGMPWHAAYSASKYGLRGVSEVLRFDLRRHRIGVTLVCPGAVDTPLVRSVDIVGIDRDNRTVNKLTERFRGHAATPDKVAGDILRGVERGRYLVYTSHDIRAIHLLERTFPPLYKLIMQQMNDRLVPIGERAARG